MDYDRLSQDELSERFIAATFCIFTVIGTVIIIWWLGYGSGIAQSSRSSADWAQWLSALATLAATFISFFGLIVSGIGLFYIAKSLKATAASVKLAEQSVTATKVSLDLSKESIEVARSTSMQESRAYISLRPSQFIVEADTLKIDLEIFNGGQTPARNLEIRTIAALLDSAMNPREILNTMTVYGDLSPNSSDRREVEIGSRDVNTVRLAMNHQGAILFDIGVRYLDVYERPQEDVFFFWNFNRSDGKMPPVPKFMMMQRVPTQDNFGWPGE